MASEQRPSVGFIGLGIMGKPMVRNLLKAGYSVTVRDVVAAPVDELVAEGAERGHDAARRRRGDRPPHHDAPRLAGRGGGLPRAPTARSPPPGPGWLAIDMSSISPRVARDLAALATAAGAEMLDAPVSGGDKGAIAGTLSIMVGGTAADFERAQPVLGAMGKTIVHVGPVGRRPGRQGLQPGRRRGRHRGRLGGARPGRQGGRRSRPASSRSCRAAWPPPRSSRCGAATCSAAPSTRGSGSASTSRISRTRSSWPGRPASSCRRPARSSSSCSGADRRTRRVRSLGAHHGPGGSRRGPRVRRCDDGLLEVADQRRPGKEPMTDYFSRLVSETPTRVWVNNPTAEEVGLALANGAVGCDDEPGLRREPPAAIARRGHPRRRRVPARLG